MLAYTAKKKKSVIVVNNNVFVWQHSVFKLNLEVVTVKASIPVVRP